MPKNVRLNSIGYFEGDGEDISETIYQRVVLMVYTGQFSSMDGEVKVEPRHILAMEANHNSVFARLKRLATGDVPMKDCPPLQLDHSVSARDTIGRVVGEFHSADVEINGKKELGLFGIARFLGKENIEKAKDGRYTNVSIGADLEACILNELSVTPFPAAPNAGLLSKHRLASHNGVDYEIEEVDPGKYSIYIIENGQKKKVSDHAGSHEEVDREAKRYIDEKGDVKMHEKLKKHLMEKKKLSEKDAEKLAGDICKSQMSKMGMDEEKMSKHLSEADEKEMSRMSEDHDEDQKKLAADTEKEEEKKLAAKTSFIKLAKGMKDEISKLSSDLRKSSVSARLARLRSQGKITPAEIKKLDIAKISNMSAEVLDATMSAFEALEPRLHLNQMTGTTKAEDISKVQEKYRLAKLEVETRMNMPSKRKAALAEHKRLAESEQNEIEKVAEKKGDEAPAKGMLTKVSYDDLCKMLDDSGRHEELKKHLKHMSEHYGEDDGKEHEDSDKHMSALVTKQTEIQKNLDTILSLAAPALGINQTEL